MKTVIELAREVGIDAEKDTLCRYEGWVEPLTRFAALVIANHPPQSFMTWQEGYEAGRQAEREACAKVCDRMAQRTQDIRSAALESAAENIRARGEKI